MKQRHRKHRRPVRDTGWYACARRLEAITPMRGLDPMTGQPWAFPYHIRWISFDEAAALWQPVDPGPKPA